MRVRVGVRVRVRRAERVCEWLPLECRGEDCARCEHLVTVRVRVIVRVRVRIRVRVRVRVRVKVRARVGVRGRVSTCPCGRRRHAHTSANQRTLSSQGSARSSRSRLRCCGGV